MKYQQINLQQIGYFLAVAKHLNFTEAAKNLYVSQPSLSKQIALLEREIDIQLFNRTKRSVQLTAAGSILFKELRDIFETIDSAVDKAKRVNNESSGNITIGCLDLMDTNAFLINSIEYFNSLYPNISIILERHSFRVLREKLINGKLDMILTLSFEVESLDVESRTIYQTNSSIWIGATHPMAKKENLKLEDLKHEKFIMISREESPNGFDGIIALCRKHGFTPNIVRQLPNAESLMLCVESGVGVALFDAHIRVHDSSKLKKISLKDDIIKIVIAWRSENQNPTVKLLVDTLL